MLVRFLERTNSNKIAGVVILLTMGLLAGRMSCETWWIVHFAAP